MAKYQLTERWVQTETLVSETSLAQANWAKVCNFIKDFTNGEINAARKGGFRTTSSITIAKSENYRVRRYNNGGGKSVFVILHKDIAIAKMD